jgi:hypothetical protein
MIQILNPKRIPDSAIFDLSIFSPILRDPYNMIFAFPTRVWYVLFRTVILSKIDQKLAMFQFTGSGFSAAVGRQSGQFDRTGNFMKMALDFMKFHTRGCVFAAMRVGPNEF